MRVQRRESFLYRKQVSVPWEIKAENDNVFRKNIPNPWEIKAENDNVIVHDDEEQIVTPFAQILATLKDVRNNLSLFVMRAGAGGEIGRRSHLHSAGSKSYILIKSCLLFILR